MAKRKYYPSITGINKKNINLKYHLYKIQSHKSKYYYIGVTTNLLRRWQQHFYEIKQLIIIRKSNGELNIKTAKKVHHHISLELFNLCKNKLFNLDYIYGYYSFSVLYSTDDINEIVRQENNMISVKTKYCLNTDKVSKYTIKNFKK